MIPSRDLVDRLKKEAEDSNIVTFRRFFPLCLCAMFSSSTKMFERMQYRFYWERHQERQKKKREEEAERERGKKTLEIIIIIIIIIIRVVFL